MNNLDQSMQIIDKVTEKMAENRREEALTRKLENNDIYADKERDMDLEDKPRQAEKLREIVKARSIY